MSADATPSRGLVLVLVSLLIIPLAMASADTPEEQIDISIEGLSVPERGYFIAGDVISFDVVLSNSGTQTETIEENPDCPASFRLVQDGEVGFDSWQENGCRNQSRGTEIAAGDSIVLDSFEYMLEEMQPGILHIEASASSTGFSTSESYIFQSSISVFSNISLEVIIAETPSGDGVNDMVEPVEALVRLVNHESSAVPIDIDEDCRFAAMIPGETTHLTELACDAGLEILPANGLVDVGWLSLDGFSEGQHELQISLPAQDDFMATAAFTWMDGADVDDHGLTTRVGVDREGEWGTGDQVSFTASIDNPGDETVNLSFQTTCRAEVHVLDQEGMVVYDTRDIRECPEVEVSHAIDAGESLVLTHSPWNFVARDGCELESGDYRLVVDAPELAIRGHSTLTYVASGEDTDCRRGTGMDLDISSMIQENQTRIGLEVELTAEDLRWAQPCRLEVDLFEDSFLHGHSIQSCGQEPGERYRGLDDMVLDDIMIEMLGRDQQTLPAGIYRLEIETNSWPSASTMIEFEWPLEEVEETQEEPTGPGSMEETISATTVHGWWQFLTTESGGCWLLTDDMGRESVLNDASSLGTSWIPSAGLAGNYSIHSTGETHHTCSQYASFDIHALQDEYNVAVEKNEEQIPEDIAEQGVISEYGATMATGVVAVSISALLIAFITTHEGVRLPLTGISLGLLGLIGRTHETNDGRFQRGRLMGYLTANPGCHFRALLAALEMSNGQLTHHIKVLEDEERIWRRGDGRLVRFYPSTISPATPSDELPVPPLSPDPNSLQGKILRLLDDDGQLGEYPTQSDLAIRLEKSQQLISHHLRTLQKFGLVEKRKFGVRNRYKLTRGALFLLESNDL